MTENHDAHESDLRDMDIIERAKARIQGSGPYELPLAFPIVASFKIEGGGTSERDIDSLMIRRPTMKEITDSATKKNNMDGLFWLIAKLTGLHESAIHAMDPDDFAEVEAMIEVFTEKFHRPGKTSSAI